MKSLNWSGIMPLALSACLATALVSCGGYDSDDSDYNAPSSEQTQEGEFRAVLDSLNPSVSNAVAPAEMSIFGDELKAEMFMGNAEISTHAQYLYAGTRCPASTDDANNDGLIDANEGKAVYGAPLLPLDSELGSPAGTFPSGAGYHYMQSASLAQTLTTINRPGLDLQGKVIVVHGIAETTDLPTSALGGKANFPVACGVLLKGPTVP